MTRGLPHRERRDHRAAARGQPDRQRAAGAARHRHARQRLRDGQPGHVRQGRPGRAGRRRAADAARQVADDRRHRGMSEGVDELLALADRVVAQARPGEQIEAFVSRGGDTEVRVYEGEVEHFVSAQSEGIGIRVDPRRPHGVRLRRHARRRRRRRGAGRGPRQRRVRHGRRVGRPGRARRRRRTPQRLWNEELADFPTERKIELAKELERLTLAVDARVRVDDANYADCLGRGGGRHHDRHPRGPARERLLRQRQHARRRRRRDPDRVRVQRRSRARRVRPRPGGRGGRRSGDPTARRHQAAVPAADRRARSVRDGPVPRCHRRDARTARAS